MMVEEGGGIPTTWNPADKSSRLVLSNGNLTVTNPASTYGGVRSIAGSATAKWYYENIYTSGGHPWAGFATAAMDLDNVVSAGALAYFGNGTFYDGITQKVSGLPVHTTFTTLRCAIDIGAQKLWMGDEGGWWNSGDPATGANPLYSGFAAGTYFAMAGVITPESVVADFGQSPVYAVPTGFGSIV